MEELLCGPPISSDQEDLQGIGPYRNTPNTMFYDTNGDGHCDKLVEDEAFGTDGFRTVKTDTDFDGRFDTLLREGGFAYSADKRDIEEAVPQIRVWRDAKSR